MSNYFDPILIDSSYKPKVGAFGKPRQLKDDGRYLVNSWFNCRELWHSQLYSLDIFFLSHKLGNGKNIAGFFDKLEDLLKIKNRTKFGPTQRKTIMYMNKFD